MDPGCLKESVALLKVLFPVFSPQKSFRNWYGRFFGYSNIRDAIAYSMNIVAVR